MITHITPTHRVVLHDAPAEQDRSVMELYVRDGRCRVVSLVPSTPLRDRLYPHLRSSRDDLLRREDVQRDDDDQMAELIWDDVVGRLRPHSGYRYVPEANSPISIAIVVGPDGESTMEEVFTGMTGDVTNL